MLPPREINWCEPLAFAAAVDVAGGDMVLLYSGIQSSYSGRFSLLAWDVAEHVNGENFSSLQSRLSADEKPLNNAWFGWFGYGLKNCLEDLPRDKVGKLHTSAMHFSRFRNILLFDHVEKRVQLVSEERTALPEPMAIPDRPVSEISCMDANISEPEYLEKVKDILAHIQKGDLYQANLTRKTYGTFAEEPDAFALFCRLCKVSPAQYSAFLKVGDLRVLSSSPERFLHVSPDGAVSTRPIKGSAARQPAPADDIAAANKLLNSAKDRAENLMIVDLMRNDLSRGCVTGSVKVPELFALDSFATIHHLSSDVVGQKRPDCLTLELVKHCFPPGSMTGAPKIAAMQLISELEPQARGIYSGAIGWFGGDGSCDLSVVIRTLILKGKQFEFQTGGGIVADSTPEAEWQEMLDKARGVRKALGVDEKQPVGV